MNTAIDMSGLSSAIQSATEAPTLPPASPAIRRSTMPSPGVTPKGMRVVKDASELNWEPALREVYTSDEGGNVRSGNWYAICRPGYEHAPLGMVSDRYKTLSHTSTYKMMKDYCSDAVTYETSMLDGHGFRVVDSYRIKHAKSDDIDGWPLSCRMVLVHDHTGKGSLRVAVVAYVGSSAVGAVAKAREIHMSDNPTRYQSRVEGLVEQAVLAQEALRDIIRKAKGRTIDEAAKAVLDKHEIKSEVGQSLLYAVTQHHKPQRGSMHWGVWQRRLTDTSIKAMCEVLGETWKGV